jgi:multiple sugar transport system substrate-binding protein
MLVVTFFVTALYVFGAGQAEDNTITVWIGGQVAEVDDTWIELEEQFEDQTGYEVEVETFGFSVYRDQLVTALDGGTGPDLAFADLGGWVPEFADQGWIMSMEDMLSEWEGEDLLWDNMWPTVQWEGERYGLPWYTDARLMLYNRSMFREAGLDPDAPPETYEELVEAATTIQEELGDDVFGYGVSGTATEHTTLGFMVFIASNNGQLLSDDLTEAAFDSPEGIEALRQYTELATEHDVSPDPVSYNEDDYREFMAQDQVAMAIGGPWSFPLIEEANPDIDYHLAVHPYGHSPGSVLGGWALVIPEAANNPDGAWEFAQFLASYDTWYYWIDQEGGPMPTRRDVAEDHPDFQDDRWQNIFEVFPDATNRPAIPVWPQVSEQIQNMVQDVLLGEATPEEAAQERAERVNEILDDFYEN